MGDGSARNKMYVAAALRHCAALAPAHAMSESQRSTDSAGAPTKGPDEPPDAKTAKSIGGTGQGRPQVDPPFVARHSAVPGRPSFRDSAINSVAVVPLLGPCRADAGASSSDRSAWECHGDSSDEHEDVGKHSLASFHSLLTSLRHFAQSSASGGEPEMSRAMKMRSMGRKDDNSAAKSDVADDEDCGGAADEEEEEEEEEEGANAAHSLSSSATMAEAATRALLGTSTVTLVVPNSQLTR